MANQIPASYSKNIITARNAGHTDQDIANYLAQNDSVVGPQVQEALQSGYDPTAIINHLNKVSAATPDKPSNAPKSITDILFSGKGTPGQRAQVIGQTINNFSGLSKLSNDLGNVLTGKAPENSLKENIGSGIQGIATVGSFGLPGASTLAGRAAQSAGISGTAALGNSMQNNQSAGSTAANTLINTAIGALIPPVLEKGSEALQQAATKRAATLYDSVLGMSKNEAKNIVRTGGQTTGEKIVASGGFPGLSQTKDSIMQLAQKGIQESENKLQPLLNDLTDKGVTINIADVVKPLQDIKNAHATLGLPVSSTLDNVINAVQGLGDTITPSEANQLKRGYYQALSKGSFDVPPDQLPAVKQVVRTIGNSLRQSIENVSPTDEAGNVIRNLNAEQGMHLDIADKMNDAIATGKVKTAADAKNLLTSLVGGGNIIRRGLEATGGFLGGGALGAIALPLLDAAASSTPGMTTRAALNTKFAQSQISPEAGALIQRLLANITGKSTNFGSNNQK